jgi:hypothetical protein
MRPRIRIRPNVFGLEARELLSALHVVPRPAPRHVEKGSGAGSSAPGGSQVGSLEGTASFTYAGFCDNPFHCGIYQFAEFASGTGRVKTFGRVRIVTRGKFSSEIAGASSFVGGGPPPAFMPPLSSSLEGPIEGAINLANATGRVVGSITFQGDSWGQIDFQEWRTGSVLTFATPQTKPSSHRRPIASGAGMVSFPEGAPQLVLNRRSATSSPVTAQLTITL